MHIINKNHRLYKYCDEMCLKSKNLYNRANYIVRKKFNDDNYFLSSYDVIKLLKNEDVYRELPAKTSQHVINSLGENWISFFKAVKDWSKNKEKYLGKPNIPNYKKKDGRYYIIFDYQQGTLKDGKYKFPKTDQYIETLVTKNQFRQLHILPFGSYYKIAIIYKKIIYGCELNNKYIAIDLGVNNIATITNNIGIKPIIINGRIIKSINNFYNKEMSKAKSHVGIRSSKRIKNLSLKRNNIIETHLHKISRYIINYCLDYNIMNIIIGKNDNWKQKADNMQAFIYIPYEKLIDKIKYKAEDEGINVITVDERYTSKSSFIDNDPLPDKFGEYEFSGKRIKRGLYETKNGILINSDVNGSYNILRKCNPEFRCDDRIKAVALKPVMFNIT